MASGFPFSAWGESLFMALQTMFIAYLICAYNGETAKGVILNVLYAAMIYVFISGALSVEILQLLQMTNVPLIVISRLIQVRLKINICAGLVKNASHTGKDRVSFQG